MPSVKVRGIYRDVMPSTQSCYLAGYGSNFGALDNAESEFARTYHNLGTSSIPRSFPHSRPTVFHFDSPVAGAFGVPSKLKILIVAMSPYLPHWMLDLMYDYFPGEGLARARENRRIATKAAKGLIEAKIQENRDGKSSRDILTLLGAFVFVVPRRCQF